MHTIVQIEKVIQKYLKTNPRLLYMWLQQNNPEKSPLELAHATKFAKQYIQCVPVILTRMHLSAAAKGMSNIIVPLLSHAEQYFLNPYDRFPECDSKYYGLAILLDDAYISLKLCEQILDVPNPLLRLDLATNNEKIAQLFPANLLPLLDVEIKAANKLLYTHLMQNFSTYLQRSER